MTALYKPPVLAIETTLGHCSVALLHESRITHHQDALRQNHSALLASLTAALLEVQGLTCADLGTILVNTGPGSFTGIRAGIAFAHGLSLPYQTPLYGTTSFHTMAYMAPRSAGGLLLDAGREMVYYQAFQQNLPIGSPIILPVRECPTNSGPFFTMHLPVAQSLAPCDVIAECNAVDSLQAWTAAPLLEPAIPLYIQPPHITTPRAS